MPSNGIVCPNCGYDFPLENADSKGFAHSDFASMVLGLGTFFCALAAVVALLGAGLSLIMALLSLTGGAGNFRGTPHFINCISLLISAIISGSLAITFSRVQDVK